MLRADDANIRAPPSLTAILVAFLRLGCISFGGGTAAWLHRDRLLRDIGEDGVAAAERQQRQRREHREQRDKRVAGAILHLSAAAARRRGRC